jgi:hypothetical protein
MKEHGYLDIREAGMPAEWDSLSIGTVEFPPGGFSANIRRILY